MSTPAPERAARAKAMARGIVASLVITMVATACGSDRSVVGAADAVSLTARVRPAADLASVATALGWTAGTPGAVVVLQRGGSTGTPIDSALTDGMGVAPFSPLTAGPYGVPASRHLTPA